eukprot:m.840817 g.840817  ORF g.840817 m.840817 type:complete len:59 (+) comp23469_c0_seq68:59-235(+)
MPNTTMQSALQYFREKYSQRCQQQGDLQSNTDIDDSDEGEELPEIGCWTDHSSLFWSL